MTYRDAYKLELVPDAPKPIAGHDNLWAALAKAREVAAKQRRQDFEVINGGRDLPQVWSEPT
jgi:hypothetical protein